MRRLICAVRKSYVETIFGISYCLVTLKSYEAFYNGVVGHLRKLDGFIPFCTGKSLMITMYLCKEIMDC